jgi:hypothetical protein
MIACGDDHSVFLTRDYELKACGYGSNGQLGVGFQTKIEHRPILIITVPGLEESLDRVD